MVDALREAHRVLETGGAVLDVRPIPTYFTLEANAAGHVTPVGEMDSYGALEDDQAADAAVARALAEGWFTLEQRVEFAFEIHWDTTADMRAHMEAGHSMRLIRPRFDEVEARRRALSATLHCTRTKLCAVYRKGPGTGPPNRGL